jgi:hypothetical protein
MSILGKINHTNARSGIRAVFSGVEKVGKTTLACSAPRALLVPLEQGFGGLTISKTPMLESFEDVISLLDEICAEIVKGTFPYQSLVIDSATALERLIHDSVLRRDPTYGKSIKSSLTMDKALGGYGSAYQIANELFFNFLNRCDWLVNNGAINIILTCHVFAAKVLDPNSGEYDTYDILLHSPKNQKSYGKREMLTQWADFIGFIHEPVFITEGKNITKATSANQGRLLGLSRTPGYVSGNRYGMEGVIPLPKEKGWNQLAHAIYTSCGIDLYNRD